MEAELPRADVFNDRESGVAERRGAEDGVPSLASSIFRFLAGGFLTDVAVPFFFDEELGGGRFLVGGLGASITVGVGGSLCDLRKLCSFFSSFSAFRVSVSKVRLGAGIAVSPCFWAGVLSRGVPDGSDLMRGGDVVVRGFLDGEGSGGDG